MDNPVVIAGSLSKEELEKSINEIVDAVDDGLNRISEKFDTQLAAIEETFKQAGTKIGTAFKDSFNAAFGGSFDQLSAAMEKMSKASPKGAGSANASGVTSGGSKNKNITYPEDSVGELRQQIKELQIKLNYEKRNTDELQKQVDLLQQAKAELKTQTTTRSLSSALAMPEFSATQITEKMKALRSVQAQNADEAKRVGNEYQRLSQRQKELLGNTNSLTNGNNALARSFGYIRNRLVYALTIGSVMNFVKQMYSVRAEYELLERSMGVLIDNFRKGSEIFNELNAMALKSPFTLVELGTAAKQLLAYNFAEDEVVDTTRRLADISAALGVPMERLVYNLGQIRAQTVLTARDARDFANAGLAIVPMLAKMYTEQKKFGDEIVTTAQVYDMMKKKLVSYEDVMKVINQVTDEGGKFFDFQAKQAETLKVQLANLTLAWNNMLNDIATGNNAALVAPISGLKSLFQNWRSVLGVVQSLIVAYGVYKAAILAVNSAHSATWAARLTVRWRQYTESVIAATGAMNKLKVAIGTSGIVGLASILAGVASYFLFFRDSAGEAADDLRRFGDAGMKAVRNVENLYSALSSINKTSGNYKKIMGELNQVLEDYGLELVKENSTIDELIANRAKNIELLKQEALEREHLNNIEREREKYETATEDERAKIEKTIASYGGAWKKYAPAVSSIVETIFEENIDKVAGKTGHEFNEAARDILNKVKEEIKKNPILKLEIDEESVDRAISVYNYNGIVANLTRLKLRKEALDANTAAENAFFEREKNGIGTQTTLNDRIEQTNKLLFDAANDTDKFYRKINQIVKDYSGKNIIDFLVDVKTKVPDWMMKMGVEDLSRLAARFTSIASEASKAGYKQKKIGNEIWDVSDIYLRGALYAEALKQKTTVPEPEQKTTKQKKDELGDALTKELQLINDIQKLYKEYTKAGIGMDEAKIAAAKEYQNTLQQTNNTLSKFGVQGLTGEELATMDLRQMRDYYQSIIDKVQSSPKAVEALEKAIRNLNVELTKEGQKTIIDSLNNELSKLKDEYELGVELDANPELGSAFAEAFGLDLSGLPTTIEEVVERAQKTIDEKLGGTGLFDILTGDIESLRTTLGQSIDSGLIDAVEKAQKSVRELWKKDAQETVSGWDKLLEKYAEYEYKRKKIMEDAEKERQLARKRGATDELINAINTKERRDLAKNDFERYQQSPEWITATGDLAALTNKAISILISDLEKYKASAKNLDPKQIKQINNALKSLYREQRKGNPFLAIANALDEAKSKAQPFIDEVESLKQRQDELTRKRAGAEGGIFISKEELEELDELPHKIQNAEDEAAEFGKVSVPQIVEGIQGMVGAINQVTGGISDMFAAFGNTEASENIKKVSQVLEKAGSFAAMGAQVGGGWGAAIGGILGGLIGGLTAWADELSGNADISDSIKRSQLQVKKLSFRYEELQRNIERAYGAEQIGARAAARDNKRRQLEQLEWQLRLEESRNSKNRDEETIVDLQGEIRSLRHEIDDLATDSINSLLGISSYSDAVSNFVDVIVDSLRNAEDAMGGFNESIDDMIANVIKQYAMASIIGPIFNNAFEQIKDYVTAKAEANKIPYEWYGYDTPEEYRDYLVRLLNETTPENFVPGNPRLAGTYEKWRENIQNTINALNEMSGIPALSDMDYVVDIIRQAGNNVEPYIQSIMDLLERYDLLKTEGENKLSNLQQGIQGITEDTAGALEAYMNGVSQQVYLHSTLLTEIRDAVVGFNMDVQLGVQSQILLELQNSYQVQMAIQGILQGWSSANGLAVRVEMV